MASAPPGLKGIDWGSYASWPSFVGSDGHTYYIPPGGQGYAYDPFLNHLFQDGRAAKATADKTAQDQQDAIKKANSPATQLTQVGGATGIAVGVPILANKLFPAAANPLEKALADKIAGETAAKTGAQAVVPNANIAAQSATQSATQGTTQGAVQNVASNGAAAGTDPATGEVVQSVDPTLGAAAPAADGSWMTAAPGTLGQVAGAAGAAYGAYNAINSWQNGGSGRAGLTEAGAGIGSFGGPIGAAIGAVGGNVLGYGLQGNGIKNDLALAALGPVGWAALGAKKLGFSPIHVTTKQTQQKQVSDLASRSDDPLWQQTIGALGQSVQNGPVDPTKPFSDGQGNNFATFQEYKNSPNGLNASNLALNPGNLDLYGPDFVKLTSAQQQAITQANINDDNYDNKKGAVVIKDPVKAKANYDSIVGGASPAVGGVPAVTTSAGTTPIATTRPAVIPAPINAVPVPVATTRPAVLPGILPNANIAAQAARTKTLSPGIGLNGQRIIY